MVSIQTRPLVRDGASIDTQPSRHVATGGAVLNGDVVDHRGRTGAQAPGALV